jgi:hypothetical protein
VPGPETEGLKEKFGKALAEPRDLCIVFDGMEGIGCCAERGRRLSAFQFSSVGEDSADRAGNTKFGFGSNSM